MFWAILAVVIAVIVVITVTNYDPAKRPIIIQTPDTPTKTLTPERLAVLVPCIPRTVSRLTELLPDIASPELLTSLIVRLFSERQTELALKHFLQLPEAFTDSVLWQLLEVTQTSLNSDYIQALKSFTALIKTNDLLLATALQKLNHPDDVSQSPLISCDLNTQVSTLPLSPTGAIRWIKLLRQLGMIANAQMLIRNLILAQSANRNLPENLQSKLLGEMAHLQLSTELTDWVSHCDDEQRNLFILPLLEIRQWTEARTHILRMPESVQPPYWFMFLSNAHKKVSDSEIRVLLPPQEHANYQACLLEYLLLNIQDTGYLPHSLDLDSLTPDKLQKLELMLQLGKRLPINLGHLSAQLFESTERELPQLDYTPEEQHIFQLRLINAQLQHQVTLPKEQRSSHILRRALEDLPNHVKTMAPPLLKVELLSCIGTALSLLERPLEATSCLEMAQSLLTSDAEVDIEQRAQTVKKLAVAWLKTGNSDQAHTLCIGLPVSEHGEDDWYGALIEQGLSEEVLKHILMRELQQPERLLAQLEKSVYSVPELQHSLLARLQQESFWN